MGFIWDHSPLNSMQIDSHDNFTWHTCVSLQMENVRFVRLALYQGKAKKAKAAVTMVMTPINKMAFW